MMKNIELEFSDIDPRIEVQVKAAEAIFAENPDYVLQLCQHHLIRYPGCLPIRKLLRRAQLELGMNRYIRAKCFAFWARSMIRKNPVKALALAEQSISNAPNRPSSYLIFAQAAERLGLFKTAAHAHEALENVSPGYEGHELSHANILLQMDEPGLAIEKLEAILRQAPDNLPAKNLLKKATVATWVAKPRARASSTPTASSLLS